MSTTSDFDRHAAAWLADGPTELADRVLDAALREVHLTHQRRRLSVPWRFNAMPNVMKLATAAVIGVIAIGVVYLNLPGRGGFGGQPTPSPTPLPIATVASSPSPVSFTSPLYGYTVDVPADWEAPSAPATDPWPGGGIVDDTTEGNWVDLFLGGGPGAVGFVGVAAQTIPDGMSSDVWMRAYAERQAASAFACKGPADAWVDAVVGTLTIRRLEIICSGMMGGEDATNLRASAVVFVVDGTGYQLTGNPEGVDALLSSFQPG